MRKADTTIKYIEPGSAADEAGLEEGDRLLKINGHEFHDILEYRYLTSEYEITLEVEKKNGTIEIITVETDYEDPGIEFNEELIDKAQSCTNNCIFCFIDQLPPGMRDTVYFKDDDTRLSFLQGNYVTLTNLSAEEIDSLIKMRVSPINISVHTTNPVLRRNMLRNRFAGECFNIMKRFHDNGIYMNCQIVLCRGINDREELNRTLYDLASLYPNVSSVSVVPVGLTAYREGLYPLTPYDKQSSLEVILQIENIQSDFMNRFGTRLVYLSDEFYVNAGTDIPDAECYEGFPQLENGVGLMASLKEEFDRALPLVPKKKYKRNVAMATGELSYIFIKSLAERLEAAAEGIRVEVYAVKNNFFGGGVTVSGLVTGGDIIDQLKNKSEAEFLIIPESMLRDGENVFLDDVTTEQVEEALGMKVISVMNDGYDFIEKIIGDELIF